MKYSIIVGLLFLTSCLHIAGYKNLDGTGATCEPGSETCVEVETSTFKLIDIASESSGDILNKNYPAPELVELQNWINSPGYDSLGELKGQVVLLDFWTLGCVNCIHTLPHLNRLYKSYKDQGFEILGVHSPEFAYERRFEALQGAVEKYSLIYPVVQDNDFATWKAYKNRYWPAHYLIDKEGNVRFVQFGQGGYDKLEQAITLLLDKPIVSPFYSEPLPLKREEINE